MAKSFYADDKLTLELGEDATEYLVTARNDEVENPPEYTFKNIKTEEVHGPVLWQWLVGEDVTLP